MKEVIWKFSHIVVLVNNAGVAPLIRQDILDMTEDSFLSQNGVTPEDVASVVSCLCDDKFIYSTGNYIDVDGAFTFEH